MIVWLISRVESPLPRPGLARRSSARGEARLGREKELMQSVCNFAYSVDLGPA